MDYDATLYTLHVVTHNLHVCQNILAINDAILSVE